MYADLFQDWTTLAADVSVTSITQSELKWGDFQAYSDIIFYTECKLLNGDGLALVYETAPAKDEALFSPLVSVGLQLGVTQVSPILLSQGPTIPLSRWVRWRLVLEEPAEAWLATFRVHIAARAVGVL